MSFFKYHTPLGIQPTFGCQPAFRSWLPITKNNTFVSLLPIWFTFQIFNQSIYATHIIKVLTLQIKRCWIFKHVIIICTFMSYISLSCLPFFSIKVFSYLRNLRTKKNYYYYHLWVRLKGYDSTIPSLSISCCFVTVVSTILF